MTTLFKLVASQFFLEKKVADFSDQSSRRVSSVVCAYLKPTQPKNINRRLKRRLN